MKAIKENWKLVLIVAAGIIAVIFMCIFGVQGAQNKAFAMEEQVNTADSDIKVQEKRRVDLVYNLADCVKQYLIQWNDAQIIKGLDEEICLLRNDFMVKSLSEEILNMTVTSIENDENIENTIVVYVADKED